MNIGRLLERTLLGSPARASSPPLWRALLPLLLLGLTSCVSNEMRTANSAGQVAPRSNAPLWVGRPASWSKLEQIERWLQFEATQYEDSWRIQGELTLGEGRLAFARQEIPLSSPSNAWLARLGSSAAGFERVLANPLRNRSQEQRARQGLREVQRLQSLPQRETERASAPARGASPTRLTRAQWRARAPIPARLDQARGGFDRITIHHTANVPGTRFDGTLADSIDVLRTIQRVHMDQRNYGDIGYHFLIDSAGRLFEGRSLAHQGAHAGGTNNQRNIGICMIGNFEVGAPSARAMQSLKNLLADLRREHGITRTGLVGHGELKATECPGPVLARWTRNYRSHGPSLAQLGARPAPVHVARLASSAPSSGAVR